MRAAGAWARAHVRRHLLALVAVGLVAALAGAVTLTAVAGARRTASSYDRHVAAVAAPDAFVGPAGFGPELWDPASVAPVASIDGVSASTQISFMAMRPVGTEYYLLFDRSVLAAADDRFGVDVNRFHIVEGRVFDHRRAEEAVVTREYAEEAGVHVGDAVRLESWTTPTVLDALFAQNYARPPPDGPVVEVTVVGIAEQFVRLAPVENPTGFVLTAAFARRWSEEIATGPHVGLVRLDDGSAGFAAFESAVASMVEDDGVGYLAQQSTAEVSQVGASIDAQVVALGAFALVAGLAGAVVLFAALARQVAFAGADQLALRTMGMTRSQRVVGVALLAAPAAVVGAVGSFAGALVGSTLVPIGTPGRLEPDPGIHLDATVLALGSAAVAAVVGLLAAAVGATITARRSSTAQVRQAATSAPARWLAPFVPVSIGVRMALDRGRGPRALPTRSTLGGCAVGIAGIVASLAFASNLHHLESTPRLYGGEAQALVGVAGGGPEEWQELTGRLEADPEVDQVATIISQVLVIDGREIDALLVAPRRGDPVNAVVSGRALQAGDEIVLGSAVADQLGVDVGDVVPVTLADGTEAPYTVVGIAAHPNTGPSYREQAALLGDSIEPFLIVDDGPWYGVAVTFRDGVDADAAFERLLAEGWSGGAPVLAGSVANLAEVDRFPVILAGVLGVFATVFLLYALAIGARRRAHDIAVLRTFGLTRRQCRRVTVAQATTISIVSLGLGLPIGLALGRFAWAELAEELGVVTEHVFPGNPAVWVVAVFGSALATSLLVAATAPHETPAATLRTARE